jgi:type II restriction enzyme
MQLNFDPSLAQEYKSPSQRARVLSEAWMSQNMYCPVCGNIRISQYSANKPVADFYCEHCSADFELKAKQGAQGSIRKIVDGAYQTMIERITSRQNPNLFFMRYSSQSRVDSVIFIPKYFFVPSIIEPRKPLADSARRAGWVGCNILYERIPLSGRIPILYDGKPMSKESVLARYASASKLETDNLKMRGWLLDVAQCVDEVAAHNPIFCLRQIYAYAPRLTILHPENNNIEAKIRQQLQMLRDRGYIEFLGRGEFRKL